MKTKAWVECVCGEKFYGDRQRWKDLADHVSTRAEMDEFGHRLNQASDARKGLGPLVREEGNS